MPASGFYEWTGEKGEKVLHLFLAADGSPVLAFADHYHDRMPVLLTPDLLDLTARTSGMDV